MKASIENFVFWSMLFLAVTACSKDDDDSINDNTLWHEFTLTEVNTYKFYADGAVHEGTLRVVNSLNTSLYLAVDMMKGNSLFSSIGRVPLPKSIGIFYSGHDFGPGQGTEGNNIYLSVALIIDDETYYAYSAHAYGFLESERVEGSECKLNIIEFSGDYVNYRFMNMTLTGFVGETKVLFTGTFKTKDGSKTIEIENGEMYILEELPSGAELL